MIEISSYENITTVLLIIFSTGFLSGLSPCTLPTITLIIGYVSGNENTSRKKGFVISLFFVLGIAFTLSILGFFAGTVGSLLSNIKFMNYIIGFILLIMGLWLLKVLDFSGCNGYLNCTPNKGSGVIGAFLLGIPFGIAASPCTMPITVSILTYSASKGSSLYGMILMFTYAVGRSIPLLIVGTFTGLIKNVKKLSKYQEWIEKIGGVILILLAFYYIYKA